MNPTTPSASKPFVFSRTFDAPRDRVWKAWTERDQLLQWFGPETVQTKQIIADVRIDRQR